MPRNCSHRPPAGGGQRSAWWRPRCWKKRACPWGDKISYDTGDGTYEDALGYEDYTVVGTVNSLDVSVGRRGSSSLGSGRVSAPAHPPGGFSMDYYTDAYLLADGERPCGAMTTLIKTSLIDSLSDAWNLSPTSVPGCATTRSSAGQREARRSPARSLTTRRPRQSVDDAQQGSWRTPAKAGRGLGRVRDGKVALVRGDG